MDTKDTGKMLREALDRYNNNVSIEHWNEILGAMDNLDAAIESEKDETDGEYAQLINRLEKLKKVTKGKINQRLQVILLTAENCRKEIKEGTIPGKKIVFDLERIAENVGDITAIMDGGPEKPMITEKELDDIDVALEFRCYDNAQEIMDKIRGLNAPKPSL